MNQRIDHLSSRRSFLKRSTATAVAASFAGPLAALAAGGAGAGGANSEYGGLPMGMQTYTLRSLSFDKALETCAKVLNIKEVEIFPGHHPGLTPPQVREKVESYGLKVSAYGVVPFSKNMDANRKYFETGKILGLRSLSCDPDTDAFDNLDKLVEEYQIAAAIHPHGPGAKWVKIQQIWDAVKDHHKLIGLCNDTGHLIRAEQDPVEACHVFKDRMYGVHFKDFKKNGKDAKGNTKWEDCVLGDGELDVNKLVQTLLEMRFRGALSLEYEGGDPVEASKKCLDRVKQAAKKSAAA
jgi:sugar phosphate isomerase/epimerase